MTFQNQAVQEYHEKRTEADFNLIQYVRQELVNAGIPQERLHYYDNDQHILDAADKKPEVMRYMLNRYWNLQLMNCTALSINERFCLIPNGSIDDWIRMFNGKILPFIIKNNLPAQI